ncbi:prepilin peptidase [Pseudomonas sp.]|uniref:prepilin peptidase n=1 Tax=Pseudomonas sp. TaxID=306 RepID=UPI003C3B8389
MTHGLVIVLWLVLCTVQDIRQRQIANGLTLGVGLLALIYLVWAGSTWMGAPAVDGGWALALALLLTLPGYAMGRLGAGDVKLLSSLALASNADYLLGTLIGAGVALGAWALLAPGLRPLMRQGLSTQRWDAAAQASKKQPFAPFVLTGFAACWYWIH